MKKQSLALFVTVVLLCSYCSCALCLTGEEIYTKLYDSIVEIVATNGNETYIGSGFYIDNKGTVVTNFHVIGGCTRITTITNDGGEYPVKTIAGFDKDIDIAVLSTTRKNTKPVEIREKPASTGETVYALGSSSGLTGTFTQGMVSTASRMLNNKEFIQTTTPVSHGNSGGPLIDSNGRVIGIIDAGLEEGQNLNFALPISVLSQVDCSNTYSIDDVCLMTAEEVLTVAIEDDYPPFSDYENGIFKGIYIDIAKEFARRLGWAVKFVPTDWEGLFKTVASTDYSMAFGISYTPERAESFRFTDDYYGWESAIWRAKEARDVSKKISFEEWMIFKKGFSEMIDDGTIKRIYNSYGL